MVADADHESARVGELGERGKVRRQRPSLEAGHREWRHARGGGKTAHAQATGWPGRPQLRAQLGHLISDLLLGHHERLKPPSHGPTLPESNPAGVHIRCAHAAGHGLGTLRALA